MRRWDSSPTPVSTVRRSAPTLLKCYLCPWLHRRGTPRVGLKTGPGEEGCQVRNDGRFGKEVSDDDGDGDTAGEGRGIEKGRGCQSAKACW